MQINIQRHRCPASPHWHGRRMEGKTWSGPEAGRGRDGPRRREMITTAMAEQENKGSRKKRERCCHSSVTDEKAQRCELPLLQNQSDLQLDQPWHSGGLQSRPGSNAPRELMKNTPGKFGQRGRGEWGMHEEAWWEGTCGLKRGRQSSRSPKRLKIATEGQKRRPTGSKKYPQLLDWDVTAAVWVTDRGRVPAVFFFFFFYSVLLIWFPAWKWF